MTFAKLCNTLDFRELLSMLVKLPVCHGMYPFTPNRAAVRTLRLQGILEKVAKTYTRCFHSS